MNLAERAQWNSSKAGVRFEGYLSGFSYLDTAHDIWPIVDKLPDNIRETWISQGSRYKAEHRVAFPQFIFFMNWGASAHKTDVMSFSGERRAPFIQNLPSKICLVNIFPGTHSERAPRAYVVLDDQSNTCTVWVLRSVPHQTLRFTCAGMTQITGSRATGLVVKSVDGVFTVTLPMLIKCVNIPTDRADLPLPEL